MSSAAAKLELAALGTHWWLDWSDDLGKVRGQGLAAELRAEIRRFEQDYSRFQPTSWVGRLNSGEQLSQFPSELWELLEFARALFAETGGVFTVAAGATLRQWGYDRGQNMPFLPAGSPEVAGIESIAAASASEWSAIFTHYSPSRLQLRPGVSLDFGGFGKGWLIDNLSAICESCSLADYLVNGGGDIRMRGTRNLPTLLADPRDPSRYLGEIPSGDWALAASSPAQRRWRAKDNQVKDHFVRASGASGELRASFVQMSLQTPLPVWASQRPATIADVAATCLFILPAKTSWPIVKNWGVESLLLFADDSLWQSPGYRATLN